MLILFYLSIVSVLGLILYYSWFYGITPTPTSSKVKQTLQHVLPAHIQGPIAELGSGWGHLAFFLAKQFPQQQVYAYEVSPIPYLCSLVLACLFNYPNVHFERANFFQISLQSFALIVCYLYPEAMIKLKAKLEKELTPGTFVLSHTFAIPGWKPIQTLKANDLYRTPIYLYCIGVQ